MKTLKASDAVVSNASYNELGPVAKVLHERVQRSLMTTVHATQRPARARHTPAACAAPALPQSRSSRRRPAPPVVGESCRPERQAGRHGIRVPAKDSSVVDLVVELEKSDRGYQRRHEAAAEGSSRRHPAVREDPIVSSMSSAIRIPASSTRSARRFWATIS